MPPATEALPMTPLEVEDAMTVNVITAGPGETLSTVAGRMRQKRVNGLPVVGRDGRLVGIITERDVIHATGLGSGADASRGFLDLLTSDPRRDPRRTLFLLRSRLRTTRVAEAMTADPVGVEPTMPLEEAARRMERYGVNRLPVVRGYAVVGVLTRADIIAALAREDLEAKGCPTAWTSQQESSGCGAPSSAGAA